MSAIEKKAEIVEAEPREIANPATGELMSRDDPAGCAIALDAIRQMEWRLKEAKRWLTDALVEEKERQGSSTLRFDGGVEVVLSGGSITEWDVTELVKLRDVGLPEARYDALVKEEVTYKVNAAEAKRIAGANPKYAEVIERAKTVREKAVSASVKVK